MHITPMDLMFDTKLLMEDYLKLCSLGITNKNQINLKYHNSLREDSLLDTRCSFLNGSIYFRKNKILEGKESDFINLQPEISGTYLEQVINEVSKLGPIGRVRWAVLPPKGTYSLHYDEDPYRFHIPVKTNIKCVFIINDTIEKMPEEGRLYRLETNTFHSAANLSFSVDRHHLLFDTIPSAEDEIRFAENNERVMAFFPEK